MVEQQSHKFSDEEISQMTDFELQGFLMLIMAKGFFFLHNMENNKDYTLSDEKMEIQAHNLIRLYTEYEIRDLDNKDEMFNFFINNK